MFPVAAIVGEGWLLLFIVLLIAPPSPGPHEGGGPGGGGAPLSPDPPAVVSLLARRLAKAGFGATLIDLAVRGWFEVRAPAGACVILLAIMIAPIVYVGAAIWLGTHGMAMLAEELVGLVVVAALAGAGVWLARRTLFARFAEFDGQVIRQWMVEGDTPG